MAVLQSRAALQAGGAQLGPALLYFGCRRREQDYIYQQELAAYEQAGVISRLSVAFSREQAEKEYVQHHLAKDAGASS
jgi:NADPH-ferrihemoprotein reductase